MYVRCCTASDVRQILNTFRVQGHRVYHVELQVHRRRPRSLNRRQSPQQVSYRIPRTMLTSLTLYEAANPPACDFSVALVLPRRAQIRMRVRG